MNVRSVNRQRGSSRSHGRDAATTSANPRGRLVGTTTSANPRGRLVGTTTSANPRGRLVGTTTSANPREDKARPRGSGRSGVEDKHKRGALRARALVDHERPRGRGRPLVDDKRRRILDAALILFAKRGYHGTAVPDVASATGVGTGTLYRYFEDKQHLVNEVYRDAKQQLKVALLDGLAAPISAAGAEVWFHELWQRLAAFARSRPDAFRFLEMQDHVEYLDNKSRALELSVLAPLWLTGKRLFAGGPPVDVAIALLWGAFVGLVKAQRLGYLQLDDKKLRQAGAAAWRLVAPQHAPSKGH